MAARMRYPEAALEELRREDPVTPISLYYIRRLAASGLIPVVKVGRRHLINYDALVAYLENPTDGVEVEQQHGVIRPVEQRL